MVAITHPARRGSDGFETLVDGDAARRQLRMSVGVVVMLSVGILSAAVTIGPHPMAARRDVVATQPLSTLHADTAVTGAKPI